MAPRGIQDSAVLAPNASTSMPTGTSSSLWRLRPNRDATAENPGTVSGLQTTHCPSTLDCGPETVRGYGFRTANLPLPVDAGLRLVGLGILAGKHPELRVVGGGDL